MTRWVLLLAISLLPLGCGKPQPRSPDQVVREAHEKEESAFFDDLEMTRAQREKVLALIEKLYEDFAEYDRTRLVLLDATIVQIQAGELKKEALLPLAEVTIAEFEKALPRGIEAMQRLHDILTRKQREELVALFTEGRELSDEERREARNNKISKVLGLTAGQKATIYPSLLGLYIKHWGTIGRFRAALHEAQDAFVQDQFVAKNLAIASELELLAVGEVIFDALEIGMNQLSREQHATLAALLDSQLRSPNPTKSNERGETSKSEQELSQDRPRSPTDSTQRDAADQPDDAPMLDSAQASDKQQSPDATLAASTPHPDPSISNEKQSNSLPIEHPIAPNEVSESGDAKEPPTPTE